MPPIVKRIWHFERCLDTATGHKNYENKILGCTQWENMTIFIQMFSSVNSYRLYRGIFHSLYSPGDIWCLYTQTSSFESVVSEMGFIPLFLLKWRSWRFVTNFCRFCPHCGLCGVAFCPFCSRQGHLEDVALQCQVAGRLGVSHSTVAGKWIHYQEIGAFTVPSTWSRPDQNIQTRPLH